MCSRVKVVFQCMAAPGGQDIPDLTGNPGMSLIVPGSAYIYIYIYILHVPLRSFKYYLQRSFRGDVRAV